VTQFSSIGSELVIVVQHTYTDCLVMTDEHALFVLYHLSKSHFTTMYKCAGMALNSLLCADVPLRN